ncbi:MAG: PEPxxWA-CTERM sorting domain-containing protein [Pseudomonadota bacterium]|nr:PEPxxWA-CTERM sorting domain-containing protein [Pseudomonadota bacterium]
MPEPETWAMLLAGLGLVGWAGRGRRRCGSLSSWESRE